MDDDDRTLIIAGRFANRDFGRYEIALTLDPDMLEMMDGIFAYEDVAGTIETNEGVLSFPEGRMSTARAQASDFTGIGQQTDQFSFQAGFEVGADRFTIQFVVAGPEFVSASGLADDVTAADLLSLDTTQLVFGSSAFGDPRQAFIDRFEFGEREGLDGFGQGLTEDEARVVALLYEVGLDRDGDIDRPGLNFWIDSRERGTSEIQLAQAFLISEEFELSYGRVELLPDEVLVRRFYVNALNREGDDAGIAFWTEQLETGALSRPGLLRAFAVSQENSDNLAFLDGLTEVAPGEWEVL